MAALLSRSVVVIAIFFSLQTFYSPQWILWIAPLLVPLARLHWPIGILAAGLDLITYLTFPVVCDLLDHPQWRTWLTELVYARTAVLGALVLMLLWFERREARTPVR
jgi:hypothetical protein